MNLFEISEKFGVSIGKLRKMQKAGIVNADDGEPIIDEMRYYLRRNQPLTLKQLMTLYARPEILDVLGKWRDQATAQLHSLGAPIDPAPANISDELAGASMNEAPSVLVVMAWMQSAIPPHREVSHYYLAARLILGLDESQRQYEFPRIGRTLLNIRKRPEFASWFRVAKVGSRNVTLYHRPRHDL